MKALSSRCARRIFPGVVMAILTLGMGLACAVCGPAVPHNVPPYTPYPTYTPHPIDTADGEPSLEVRAGRHYLSDTHYLHIMGEVINHSDEWRQFVRVDATYYDADGNILDTGFTYTQISLLPPYGSGTFELSDTVAFKARKVTSYTLEATTIPLRDPRCTDFEVTHAGLYQPDSGYLYLGGVVKNTGKSVCEFVDVAFAFYDADGMVVYTDITRADPDWVRAGRSTAFERRLEQVDEMPEYDHFRLWAVGHPTSVIRKVDQ